MKTLFSADLVSSLFGFVSETPAPRNGEDTSFVEPKRRYGRDRRDIIAPAVSASISAEGRRGEIYFG